MDKIIVGAPINEKIPKESAGKIMLNRILTFDKNSIALFEIMTGISYTYGDLIEHSLNMATNLRHMYKIRKNDHFAVICENSGKFWIIALAGLYLATPLHLLNPGYTTFELRKFLAMSQPKVVFCSKSSFEKVLTLQKELDFIKIIVSIDANGLLYDDLIKNHAGPDFEIVNDFDTEEQVAFICNSSGTVGLPKGVMIPHENFRLNISQCLNPEQFPQDRQCILQIIPFYHVYGFNVTSSALYLGAKIVIMDQFQPIPYLENIQYHKVNLLFIVPALAHFLANSDITQNYDLSSLSEIYSAAGTLSEQIVEKIKTKLVNLKTIHQSYGLTETSSAIFMTTATESRPGSCGKVTPGHTVKVVDVKTKEPQGVNCFGEICVKGGSMIGYLNDKGKTQETIDEEGFIHSGDMGYYDEAHFFYIIDRLKDIIKYKSFQVAPVEIEEILLRHESIADVAVVGKPDDRCGELPVAFVVRRKDAEINEQQVLDYVAEHVCMEKRLHGGVRFVGEIPRSGAGKILRKNLRDLL